MYKTSHLLYLIYTNGIKIQDSLFSILGSIGTFAAVIVALLAIFLPIYLKHKSRPILKIEFSNTEPFCRHVSGVVDLISRTGQQKEIYFVRLRIKNRGESLAKGCQGELIAIANKDLKSLRKDFDPVVLNWVGSDKYKRVSSTTSNIITNTIEIEKTPTKDINAQEYQYLDLFSVEKNRSRIDIQAIDRDIPRGIVLDPELDDYFLLVTIYSENAIPESEVFKLTKERGFDTVSLRKSKTNERERFYRLLVNSVV